MQSQILKFSATLLQNLPEIPEKIMQQWIEDPQGLQKFLASLNMPPSVDAVEFPTWRTVKLGIGFKNADDFRSELKNRGMKIGDWADNILGQPAFTVATQETELDLVVISVADLGFKKATTRKKIYARAEELGLNLCPVEVGPRLRLQYADQPNGECLIIAMEPITDSFGGLELFRVKRGVSGLWLCGD
jgi:hypothetical protein